MDKRAAIITFVVITIILSICYLPSEYEYITAQKTKAVICSEGYTQRFTRFGSKSSHFYYTVEYEVDGQKYVSQFYQTKVGTLQKGNIVTLYYKGSNPEKVVEVSLPIMSIFILFSVIAVIRACRK